MAASRGLELRPRVTSRADAKGVAGKGLWLCPVLGAWALCLAAHGAARPTVLRCARLSTAHTDPRARLLSETRQTLHSFTGLPIGPAVWGTSGWNTDPAFKHFHVETRQELTGLCIHVTFPVAEQGIKTSPCKYAAPGRSAGLCREETCPCLFLVVLVPRRPRCCSCREPTQVAPADLREACPLRASLGQEQVRPVCRHFQT